MPSFRMDAAAHGRVVGWPARVRLVNGRHPEREVPVAEET